MLCCKNSHTLISCSIQVKVRWLTCKTAALELQALPFRWINCSMGIKGLYMLPLKPEALGDKISNSWVGFGGTVAMLACLHDRVQHVQFGFIPLGMQQQRSGHPCLKSQWSSTAQSDMILGISAPSSVTTNLLFSSLHFTSMCFSYLSFCATDDYSVALFLLVLLIYFLSLSYFSFSQDKQAEVMSLQHSTCQ